MPTRSVLLSIFTAIWLASWAALALKLDLVPTEFENRRWAEFPPAALLLDSPSTYTTRMSAFAADHFGLRSALIRLHNLMKFYVFRTSPSELVVLGKDDWLFWAGENSLAFYRNISPFHTEELGRLRRSFTKAQAWLSRHGVEFMVIVPPDPPTVYPEKLPDWLHIAPGRTRRTQLIEATNGALPIPILDLAPILAREKSAIGPYFSTDSHWNAVGGLATFDAFIKDARARGKNWPPFDRSRYSVGLTRSSGLDLARAIGLPDLFSEQIPTITSPDGITYSKQETSYVHNFSTHCEACLPLRVIVLRDSYGIAIQPFISEYFRDVTYIWDNQIPFKAILELKPDLLIWQFVERKLTGLPPIQVPD